MTPIPRLKPQGGPALLSYGFRPFFLFGALYGVAAMLVWLPQYTGALSLPGAFAPLVWHAHEMIFGFIPAVVAGFLMTAVPNWTGRMPLQGSPLLALVLIWLAGRLAIALSGAIGWAATMVVDSAFLVALVGVMGREIVAGKNWRNLRVLAIVGASALANIGFHVEAHLTGAGAHAQKFGVAAALALVILVGGRIVPSFTRNWLARNNPGPLPAGFDTVEKGVFGVTLAALAAWALGLGGRIAALLLVVAGLGQAWRLVRWQGARARADALVLVMHTAYAFIPAGFLLMAAAAAFPAAIPASAGLHAWMVGGVAGMILAVMTRASLGHTGRALQADGRTVAIYVALFVAALARIGAALAPGAAEPLLWGAALAWIAAFGGFAAVYGPYLTSPRRNG
jgi:uncharacterized protein involved in response to NO